MKRNFASITHAFSHIVTMKRRAFSCTAFRPQSSCQSSTRYSEIERQSFAWQQCIIAQSIRCKLQSCFCCCQARLSSPSSHIVRHSHCHARSHGPYLQLGCPASLSFLPSKCAAATTGSSYASQNDPLSPCRVLYKRSMYISSHSCFDVQTRPYLL